MRTIAAASVAMILLAAPALAAGPDESATELSTQIMSPFCPGVTLHECPSAEALRLRDRIETWYRDGMTTDQILARLETEYGRGIRAAPSPQGMGLAAWLVTGAGVLLALGIGAILLRKWSRKETGSTTTGTLDPGDRRRLDEELARLRTQA